LEILAPKTLGKPGKI